VTSTLLGETHLESPCITSCRPIDCGLLPEETSDVKVRSQPHTVTRTRSCSQSLFFLDAEKQQIYKELFDFPPKARIHNLLASSPLLRPYKSPLGSVSRSNPSQRRSPQISNISRITAVVEDQVLRAHSKVFREASSRVCKRRLLRLDLDLRL
jgi:hypothetical protein